MLLALCCLCNSILSYFNLDVCVLSYSGEKFDMYKAKEICERYRGILPTSATVADVYVAINSQYHDYAELFKNWFGDGIEQKIVESAIVFWFKDADCKAENKVVEYLGKY